MSDLISKQALVDHIDHCANDLMERGGVVPAGVLVILRDAIESGGFDTDPDSEIQRLEDENEQIRESQQTTLLRNLQLAKDLEESMDEVQRLREALEAIKSANAGRMDKKSLTINWIVDNALSPQKGETRET